MNYANMVSGTFLARPNRFIAYVDIAGQTQTVHVKNTGRCRELLVPGTQVWCQEASSPVRKTRFDLIAVQKGSRLINMDSQAPNTAAKEWLLSGGFGKVDALRAETVHGDSRFDFSFLKDGTPWFLEVKGVTLEENGHARFPDAPTERGVKHLHELRHAVEQGLSASLVFIVQMEGMRDVSPNDGTHPAFGAALWEAAAAGVGVRAFTCAVKPDSIAVSGEIPVIL